MSDKWHIGKNGMPAVCKASKRKCPIGGEHFDSLSKATGRSTEILTRAHPYPKISKASLIADNVGDKMWEAIDKVDDFTFGEKGSVPRFIGVSLAGTAAVVGTFAGPFILADTINSNNAQNSYNSTPYSVSSTVRDGNNTQFTGKVKTSNLQESSFNNCTNSSKSKGYVVCKTTDGKYTVTAKTEEDHTKQKSWVVMSRVQVKDNTNGSVHNLKHELNGDGINIYIPKNAN